MQYHHELLKLHAEKQARNEFLSKGVTKVMASEYLPVCNDYYWILAGTN